ncbi:ABC transporter ATP-binding protein [Halorientalis regularis]|jgi:ABC-2 type transport system ATP-binding protein|uniref:ABC-2 type transport system ATP-binding protein n=1 Tax=Halorientalis regularis TaxID=660518 RepID=A0A1G7FRU7_9EURY|nr:ABC transporter ATP-binding protein [Halorientalis regularis]SDE78647.1 ABC-2 type transport system ATP-binding protein [Halorientalis regularis]
MTAIETEELTKRYGDVSALVDLSLTVPDGELFALLGPNGSGKTTTIEILTGQLEPTSGTASVLGHDPVTDPLAVRGSVGILPEREDPPSFLTPREYLEFVGSVRDLDDVTARIDEWAERFEFAGLLDTLSTDLSEGERQRVMLAAAFVHEPDLVFIDEPLVNLDPLMQEQIKGHFREYVERGNTVFLSTHFIEVAEELCTRVAIVSDGRLVAERDPRELGEGERLLDVFRTEVNDADTPAGPAQH